ncbi:MAG: sugar phosphate isomerase/epimerase [Clostridia bacterium]|nr:sugar phosphate isomerase/epimerase [Clostridia bacterium]
MKNSYGLQLYSVRDITKDDLAGALESVAKIGYKFVEFAGFFGHSSSDVKAMLENCSLEISGTHSPLDDLRPTRIMETVRYHREIGNPNYIVPGADLSTLEKIHDFCSVMNFAKPILAAEGIRLGYHNHSHEFSLMPWGSTIHSEIERNTDIEFEIDTYWAFNAGLDPVRVLERLKDRISVIHLKDGFMGGKGMALGEGEAPVNAVIKASERLGFKMVVESETLSPTGLEEVTRCMNYLKSIDQ